jgi:hypothetical protein
MPSTIFANALMAVDKSDALLSAIDSLRAGTPSARIHFADTESLAKVPGTPFGYWVSDDIRTVFKRFPQYEIGERRVRAGLQTSDDFRFVRAWWEVQTHSLLEASPHLSQEHYRERTNTGQRWVTLAKGGGASAFSNQFYLVVDWACDGKEMKAWNDRLHGGSGWSRNIRSTECYFLPGLSWAVRTRRFSPHVVPAGGIFSVSRYQAFAPAKDVLWILALLNSSHVTLLLRLCSERYEHPKYVVGIVSQLPFPEPDEKTKTDLERLSTRGIRAAALRASGNECSRFFRCPAVLRTSGSTLRDRISLWKEQIAKADSDLSEVLRECTEIASTLYGFKVPTDPMEDGSDVAPPEEAHATSDIDSDDDSTDEALNGSDEYTCISEYVSFLFGCLAGRWCLATATSHQDSEGCTADIWQVLPTQSPAMATVTSETTARKGDGIACDDADHPHDVICLLRGVAELLWNETVDSIEAETCRLLSVRSLRDYFRKPGKGGFWDDHVSRYSKSRRKAPIYWLLQSSKKNYAIWLYYHRLDKDILFKALVNYVEPKIRLENDRLGSLRSQKAAAGAGKGAKKLDKEIEKQEEFLSELRDFEEKLRRAADLHLVPDLNDGVVLNIAPLHELVPWKEAEKYWEELLEGKYEWSSIGKQLRDKGLVK